MSLGHNEFRAYRIKGSTSSWLPEGKISTICTISVSRNARKWKHIFMFRKVNSTLQGLTHCGPVMAFGQRSGSTLAQVVAWWVMAPSHCLNQFGIIMSKVLWHSSEGSFTAGGLATILYTEFENYTYKITTTFHRAKLVKVKEKNEVSFIIQN